MDERDSPDKKNGLIPSNYVKGDRAYLLNAKPGRYAVIGAFYRKRAPSFIYLHTVDKPEEEIYEYNTYFSRELVDLSGVTVTPGTVAFMGAYVVEQFSGSIRDPDTVSLYRAMDSMSGSGPGTYSYIGVLHSAHRDERTEGAFWGETLKYFQGSGWEDIIRGRVRDLKSR